MQITIEVGKNLTIILYLVIFVLFLIGASRK